ncbi:unnamed protein product [Diatraea saccharalis]|uniref:Uncharacterized protein n=1 Tax=Diatraea saccharalis TaxID=40085 RepID=A0A9P0C3E2_9NEOP|nr:unnamed protein product [Diatraea saccharalis]
MNIFINILLKSCIYLELLSTIASSPSFFYEKMHNFGLGKRIHDYRRMYMFKNQNEYPAALPTITPNKHAMVPSPYHSIYQGHRMPNDTRVFRRRFEYEAQPSGHHVYCEGSVNCVISHLAIETAGGIPILLRGGAGYRYLVVVIKAKPYTQLVGSVRAYCLSTPDDYYTEKLKG